MHARKGRSQDSIRHSAVEGRATMIRPTLRLFATFAAAIPMASCIATRETPPQTTSTTGSVPSSAAPYSFGPGANLIRSDGAKIGQVRTASGPQSVAVGIVANGVPSGVHRIYFHAVGRCEPPAFTSAGAAAVGQSGQLAPPDLGRVTVDADGRIYMTTLAEGMKLRPSDPGSLPALLDADGASLVIHAGNRRIACAELR